MVVSADYSTAATHATLTFHLMTSDLVSTIIPALNRRAQLQEAVQSVLDQDYRPIEVIIVDDGSTDDTFAAAQAFASSHGDVVRAVTQSNGGPGLAREHGRQLARGEFIQYLDSDDVLLPGKFTAQVAALRAMPAAGVAYGLTRFRQANGDLLSDPWKGSGVRRDAMFPSFLTERWWDTPTPLYRAALCEAAGPWTDLRLEEDWEYDCRVAALGTQLAWCDVFVAEVRDHDGGRLCRGTALDSTRNSQRARSHELIYGHAVRAGLSGTPEMQHFARALFLLARQCGASGLAEQSQRLFALAQQASGDTRSRGADFRAYGLASKILGWTTMGRVSHWMDGMRR